MAEPTDEMKPPATPMCDKWGLVVDDARTITEFLDWLRQKYDVEITPSVRDDKMLYEFFEIDADQLETERRALLDYQRKLNEK